MGSLKKTVQYKLRLKKKTKATFEVEWDEFDKRTRCDQQRRELRKKKRRTKRTKTKGLNKFLKKLGVEEEEKKKVEIEIEG